MCWSSRFPPIKETASEDIPVFKIVRSDMRAYYFDEFKYIVGELHHACIGAITKAFHWNESCYDISQGLHSYAYDCIVIENSRDIIIVDPEYRKKIGIYPRFYILKLNCVIPKGATYYLNEKGEYISNRLIVLSAE